MSIKEKAIASIFDKTLQAIKPAMFAKKAKLNFLNLNFNIGISIQYSSGERSEAYQNTLIKKLQRLIDQYKLSSHIKIYDFSDLKKFKNKEEAQGFRNKKNIDLLVWGDFSNDILKKKGEKVTEPHFYFTYGHPSDKNNRIGRMVKKELKSILASKKFDLIFEKESFEHLKVLPERVFDISIYIIGLTLLLFGKINKSIVLFESILPKSLGKKDSFSNGVKIHLINLYDLKLEDYMWSNNSFEKALSISLKLLSIKKNSLNGLAAKAYYEFKLGRLDNSKETVKSIQKIYPNHQVTWVNIAFFKILEKQYKQAFKYYEKFENVDKPLIVPIQVIDFLDHQHDLHPNEPAFLFASEIMNYYFGDKKRSEQLFRGFLRNSHEYTYKYMYRKTKYLLKNINKLN